jgi:aminoglycoside phosphotransferase (APT) family kinase protein
MPGPKTGRVVLRFLGHLPYDDPLRHYLQAEILPQLGWTGTNAEFRVFRLGERSSVYLYEERHSGVRVVGKFFARLYQLGTADTNRHMDREYENLQLLRSYGLVGYPHNVVRPLGRNGWLSSLLVEEYVGGRRLSSFLDGAVLEGKSDALYAGLTALHYFLATLHNGTANGLGVDFGEDCHYMDRIVQRLLKRQTISADEAQELYWLRDRWAEQPHMWEDQQVLAHGDATPANFLLGDGLQVTAVDLERMRRGDRVFDVGRIAGEIQHTFMLSTGNKYAAKPFIGHFLWEYACHFPDRDRAFASISGRVPFQMAVTLLRIARNDWIEPWHRRRLVEEAKMTLRTLGTLGTLGTF